MEWYKGSWRLKWLDRDGYVLTFENLEGVLIKRPFQRRGVLLRLNVVRLKTYRTAKSLQDSSTMNTLSLSLCFTTKRKVLINRSNRSLEGPREDIFRRRILGRRRR